MDTTMDLDTFFENNQVATKEKEVKVEETKKEEPVVQTSSAQVEEAQVKTSPQVVQQGSSDLAVPDDFDIDLDEGSMQELASLGIQEADIGVKVSRVPIERYKASASKTDRISFISRKVIPIKYHFVEGNGSILCFHGKCCEVEGNPSVRYLFPIAVYQSDSEGNISGSKVDLKVLSAGDDLYKSIIALNKGLEQYGGITHADILVTCTDEKYQKITLTFSGSATWRKYKPLADFLAKRWKEDGAKAYMAIARKVDESSFLNMVHMDEPAPSFNEQTNQDISKYFE